MRHLPALVADLGVRGLWAAQTEALFDIRVMGTDVQSYTSCTVDSVLLSAKNEKKKKYLDSIHQLMNRNVLLCVCMHVLMIFIYSFVFYLCNGVFIKSR